MTRFPETDNFSDPSRWLMGTISRNPEGLLLLAAGCALLMRSGSRTFAKSGSESRSFDYEGGQRSAGSSLSSARSKLGEGMSRAAESASDYASGIKDSVTDAASSYTATVSDYASDARSTIAQQSERMSRQAQSTFQGGMERMLREQPLAVAVIGVAAGAAVAAAFPSTEAENRALGGAKEALTQAAGKAGENLTAAAGAAGERLKTVAEEKGLNPAGLKEMARDVAGTFTDSVAGKTDEHPSLVPAAPSDQFGAGAAPRTPGVASSIGRDGR